jgi:hypothetical protein
MHSMHTTPCQKKTGRRRKKGREEGERGSEDRRKEKWKRGRGMAKRERGDKGGEKEGVDIYVMENGNLAI